jgi:hypothetical protein
MKSFILIAILASLFSASAFAEGEVETECPMMREMNKRLNTKLHLSNDSKKPAQSRGSKGSSI